MAVHVHGALLWGYSSALHYRAYCIKMFDTLEFVMHFLSFVIKYITEMYMVHRNNII